MKAYRNSRLTRICVGVMGLTGMLVVSGRVAAAQQTVAAQAQDSAPMTLIVAVFPDQSGAGQAMSQMSPAQRNKAESYAVVSKDANGKVKVHDKQSKKDARGNQAKNSIDGAVALLGRPPSTGGNNAAPSNRGDTSAANQNNPSPPARNDAASAASAQQAGVSQSDAEKISTMLPPDNSAILLVVPAADVAPTDAALQQAHPTQMMGAPMTEVGP